MKITSAAAAMVAKIWGFQAKFGILPGGETSTMKIGAASLLARHYDCNEQWNY